MFGVKKVTNTISKTTWQKFLESGPSIFSRLSWMMLTSAVNHGRKVMFGLKNTTNTFSKTTWQFFLESGPNMFSRFSWMLLTFVGRNI